MTLYEQFAESGYTSPLKLSNPIMVNNKQVSELEWSPDDVTVELFDQAANLAAEGAGFSFKAIETDIKMHRLLGCAMVIAANPQIDFRDLEQLKGLDVLRLAGMGRFLVMRSVESQQSDSDESSDSTPETSTLPEQKSENETSGSSSKTAAKH